MSKQRLENLIVGDAKIMWRNFSGAQTEFNPAGIRNFHVRFQKEDAEALAQNGWNIKAYIPKNAESDDDVVYHLKVAVRYNDRNPRLNPRIWFVNGHGKKVQATEQTVGMLDAERLEKVDLVIRPSVWEVNGKSGIKAYLDVGYFVIEEDPFSAQYEDGYSQYDDEDVPF